jgi:tRNA A-37 threonylcarbamoyl transferase component Bud32
MHIHLDLYRSNVLSVEEVRAVVVALREFQERAERAEAELAVLRRELSAATDRQEVAMAALVRLREAVARALSALRPLSSSAQ